MTDRNVTFNVTMKERFVAFMDRLAEESGCSTRSEYLRVLVRRDADRLGISMTAKKKGGKRNG